MRLSIIVPVYNVEPYLEDCLESIIGKNLDCEVILIEDGSTDRSMDICRIYTDRYQYFSLYHNEGKGLADARNKGLKHAVGDYIWFVDSDDLIWGEVTEKLFFVIDHEQPDLIVFDALAFNETDKDWNLDYYDRRNRIRSTDIMSGREFFKKNYLRDCYRDSACLALFKKEFLDRSKIRFASGRLLEDTAFTFEVYMSAGTVKYIPEFFYRRRYRDGSITTTEMDERKVKDLFRALKKNAALIENADSELQYVCRQYFFDHYLLQTERIAQLSCADKRKYYIDAFEAFFTEYGYFTLKQPDLSGLCLILFFMDRMEQLLDRNSLEGQLYKSGQTVYGWKELKEKVKELYRTFITGLLEPLPFDKEVCIGVYGVGKHTEDMLAAYREFVGRITAEIVYLDSNAQSHAVTFEGSDVLNIRDIPENLHTIIISSRRYQEEMYHTARAIYADMNIIKLYTKPEDTFDYFIRRESI